MWFFTTTGFYSAVQDFKDNDKLWIRARIRKDLEILICKYSLTGAAIVEKAVSDYPCRISLNRAAFVDLMAKIARDISYNNFKDEVAVTCGEERAHVYFDVWHRMYKMQHEEGM
jgi:hypothetical protein